MATKNPRIAAYPPLQVYERLVEFKHSQGLKSDSAAIVAILETYLGGSIPNVLPSELSGTPKRIEDLEVKVSSLVSDVAALKQAMSQDTFLSSGEDLLPKKYLHQPDNCEALSEPQKKSPNTTFDLTNESVAMSVSTSRSELQTTGADGDTQLVKSSVYETDSTNSKLSNEPLPVTPTTESILNYLPVQESTLPHSELPSELLDDSLKQIISEPVYDSLDGLPRSAENNHPKVSSLNSEPPNDLPYSSLDKSESKNSQQVQLHLTGAALARRLNISPSTLRHKKNAPNFGQWTSLHDPDGIAWHFNGEKFIEKPSPDSKTP